MALSFGPPTSQPSNRNPTEAGYLRRICEKMEGIRLTTDNAKNEHTFEVLDDSKCYSADPARGTMIYVVTLSVRRRNGQCSVRLDLSFSLISSKALKANTLVIDVDGSSKSYRERANNPAQFYSRHVDDSVWLERATCELDDSASNSLTKSETVFVKMVGTAGEKSIRISPSTLGMWKQLAQLRGIIKAALNDGVDVFELLEDPAIQIAKANFAKSAEERREVIAAVDVVITPIEDAKYTHKITVTNHAKFDISNVKIAIRRGNLSHVLTLPSLAKGESNYKRLVVRGAGEITVNVQSLDYDVASRHRSSDTVLQGKMSG